MSATVCVGVFVWFVLLWRSEAALRGAPCQLDKFYDIVVVGTGPSSGPLIRRLADQGYNIAVLEKGPFFVGQTSSAPSAKPNASNFDDTFEVHETVFEFGTVQGSRVSEDVHRYIKGLTTNNQLKNALKVEPNLPALLDSVTQRSTGPLEQQQPVPLRDRRYPYFQVQGFGGQTLTYGGLNIRPSPASFASWGALNFSTLLPFYRMTERFHFACLNRNAPDEAHNCGNMTGFMSVNAEREDQFPPIVGALPALCANANFSDGMNTCGLGLPGYSELNYTLDYNAAPQRRAFCGPPQFFGVVNRDPNNASRDLSVLRGTLQSTYLPQDYVASSTKISVCVNATVRRLIFTGGKISGAQIAGTEEIVRGRIFIVCSGVRHTPALLLSSGIGSAKALANFGLAGNVDLPGVGAHFHDEWAFGLSFRIRGNASYWIGERSVRNRDQLHLVKLSSGAQGNNFTDVQLYLRLDNSLTLDQYLPGEDALGFQRGDHFGIRVALFQADTFGEDSGVRPTHTNGVYVDKFLFNVSMFNDVGRFSRFFQGAKLGFARAMQLVARMMQQNSTFGPLQLTPSAATARLIQAANDSDSAFAFELLDAGNVLALHGGGTCGIGRCVNNDLQVIGVPNLFVCDMSVFPTPIDANPTATLFALGEFLASRVCASNACNAEPTRQPSTFPTPEPSHPTTPSPSPAPTPCPACGSCHCFPKDSQALLASGVSVSVADLKLGDKVMDGINSASTVVAFTHRDSAAIATFVRLGYSLQNDTITPDQAVLLTGSHYLHLSGRFAPAASAKVGDTLLVYMRGTLASRPVLSVDHVVREGLFNPHTASGHILVDGVLTSCYTSAVWPQLAHLLLFPLRWTEASAIGTVVSNLFDLLHALLGCWL